MAMEPDFRGGTWRCGLLVGLLVGALGTATCRRDGGGAASTATAEQGTSRSADEAGGTAAASAEEAGGAAVAAADEGTPARREPVTVEIAGWAFDGEEVGPQLHQEWRETTGSCVVELDRWWGVPPTDGGPMQVASRRSVTVDGREAELLTTSTFQGVEQEARVMFFSGAGFTARVTFRDCAPGALDDLLGRIRLHF
jgi:hypothetical protein